MSARSKKAKQAEPGSTDATQSQVAAAGTGEDTPPPASVDEPLVVGIGASAGGQVVAVAVAVKQLDAAIEIPIELVGGQPNADRKRSIAV